MGALSWGERFVPKVRASQAVARVLVALLIGCGALALMPALAAASSVTSPTVVLTTTTAGASGVTYEVGFTPTASIPANSGTITVAAPSGTVVPNQSITVRDPATGLDLGGTGLPTFQNGHATATWTLSGFAVQAGHRVELEVLGVTNAPSGSGQLVVSTSADTTPVGTSAFSLSAPQAVSSPSVSLTTPVQGATGATYLLDFTTSSTGGLAPFGGTLTVALPAGSLIPNQGISITDLTTGDSLFASILSRTNSNATATFQPDETFPAGHKLELEITGVTNASSPSANQITISTSSDPTTATTPAFSLTAPQAVSSPSVSLNTPVQGATGATYLLDFTTSSTGALASGNGTLTVALPAGSVIANHGVSITDLTTGDSLFASILSRTNSNATATFQADEAFPAGHKLELEITGVTNASSPSGNQITISTSSDPTPATTAAFSLSAPQAVSSPSVSLTTPVQGATGATYLLDFTTSSTGGLAPFGGTLTVALPAGSVIPNQGINITDLTTGDSLFAGILSRTNSNATATFQADEAFPAGHKLELEITGVTNASSPSANQITISSSSDLTPATTPAFSLTARQAITAATLAISNQTASGTGVRYSLDFTTSSTGGLASGNGTLTVALPAGSVIPNQGINITDLTTGDSLFAGILSRTNSNATATFVAEGAIPAGHRIRAVILGVTNPGANQADQVSVSTSSDSAGTAPPFQIGGSPTPPSVGPTVLLSSTAAGVSPIGYTIVFTTSSTGALTANQGTITLAAPRGTSLPSQSIDVFDITTQTDLGLASPTGSAGSTQTYTVPSNVPALHEIQLTLSGVTNPPAAIGDVINVATSAQAGASTNSYTISSAQSVVGASVALSSPVQGEKGVTYTIGFTTSATGALASDAGTITLTAPTGTVLPANSLQIFDVTDDQLLGTAFASSGSGNSRTWTAGGAIPAGHTLRLTLTGVTNASSLSGNQITISTSSDTTRATTPSYALTAAQAVSGTSVALSSLVQGEKGVTYTFGLTTSATGALASDAGTITLTAPTGTVLPANSLQIFDMTDDQLLGTAFASSGSGNSRTWTAGSPIPAGHTLRLTLMGVTNASSPSGNQITISTSSDTTRATTPSYALTSAQAVSGTSVALSSPVQGEKGVTYTFGLTTSATGALASDAGTITLTAPTGTVLPANSLQVFDLTEDQFLSTAFASSGSGNSRTWTAGSPIPAGHTLRLTLMGVTNASSPSGNQITISTSSDITPATTPSYALTSAQAVAGASVALSSPAQGATNVTYALGFTTSSTGGLVADQGTITLTAPSGTVLPGNSLQVFDVTEDQFLSTAFASSGSGNSRTWTAGSAIPAGHTLRLTLMGVTNANSPSGNQITISTSSDTATAKTPFFTLGTPQSVSSPTVGLSSSSPGASNVDYTIGFTTSSSGGLPAGSGVITALAPAGTVFANAPVDLFDVTANTDLGNSGSPTLSDGGASATWTVGATAVPAGHQIRLTATGVKNPVAGTYALDLTTSSDTVTGQTPAYQIGSQGSVPTVTAVSPSSGPAAGATNVTITGTNFTGATGVSFGPAGASNVTVVSPTKITATSPAGSGTVDVTVTTPGGTSPTTAADHFTYSPAPTVTSVSPGSGPAAGGTSVTITGTSFTGATAVQFGGIDATTFSVDSATQITATSPGGFGTVDVTVATLSGGTSTTGAADRFTYNSSPAVTNVSPGSGPPSGGTSVTITGTSFTSASAVKFGAANASTFHVVSATQITATSPAGTGSVDVTVTTPNGTSGLSAADHFTYALAPTVTALSPGSGPAGGGTSVTINGTNFNGATALKFGAANATAFHVVSATQITATSPAGSGSVDITVKTNSGTSAVSAADHFTYTPGPITATGGKAFTGSAPAAVSGTVATFVDPDSQTPASEYSATIGWGDGTTSSAGAVTGGSGSFSVTASHTYTLSGSFTITVTITDVHNAANTATVTDSAAIAGTGPVVTAGSPSVQGSNAAAFTGSVDPNGLLTTVHFEYGLDAKYRASGGAIVYDQSTQEQAVGSDFTTHAVSVSVSGLVPNAVYHERLVATNSDGTTAGPDQTFKTTKDPAPPAPVLGKSVNATPVSGVVFIKPPPGKSLRALGAQFSPAALTKGHGFVPLTEARQLPSGSQVDARRGALKLITASARSGKTQQGVFGGGLFKLAQKRSGLTKGLTTLSLLEGDFAGAPSYSTCKAHGAADGSGPVAQAARLSRRILQTLHARDNHGRFRTRGRYSAATVRGTVWDTTDRCDGTVTAVHRGTVLVDDFRRRRTVTVRAGHSYLASAIKRRHK